MITVNEADKYLEEFYENTIRKDFYYFGVY